MRYTQAMRRALPLLLLLALSACAEQEAKEGKLIIYRPVDMAVVEGDNLVWAGSTNWAFTAHHDWTIETGTLPPGMTLTPDDNVFEISGVCTVAGDYPFTLKADVEGRIARTSVLFRVAPTTGPLTIYSPAIATAVTGVDFGFEIIATGGSNAGYNWAVTAGSLPPGLAIQTSTMGSFLAGKATTKGTYSFTLELTDSAANTTSASFTMEVVQIVYGPA